MSVSYTQNCKKDFIGDIERSYWQSKKKFDKIIKKSIEKDNLLKSADFDNFLIINIPVIVGKKTKGIEINKANFFCHLNSKKIEFDEAVILKESTVLGIVTQCPGVGCKYEFNSKSPYIDLHIRPLVRKLTEIRPDIVLSIYHIPNAYWYIKNGELSVLAFEKDEGLITDIRTYKAEEYIQSLSEEDVNSFLYFTRTKVISY